MLVIALPVEIYRFVLRPAPPVLRARAERGTSRRPRWAAFGSDKPSVSAPARRRVAPASRCAMCRTTPATATRAPHDATTEPGDNPLYHLVLSDVLATVTDHDDDPSDTYLVEFVPAGSNLSFDGQNWPPATIGNVWRE